MAGAIIGGTIAAAGALGGAAMGSASSASAAAANKQMMEDIFRYSHGELKPYRKLGKQGAQIYQQMLPGILEQSAYQPYTNEQYQQSPLYTPMVTNLAELQATPGYQFQLQQGQKALAQTAAARGGLLSGAQMQAAQGFGQQQAATGFQAAWQRAQDAYSKAFEQNLAAQRVRQTGAGQQANILGNVVSGGYNAVQAPYSLAQGLAPTLMESNMANAANQGTIYSATGQSLGRFGQAIAPSIYSALQPAGSSLSQSAGLVNAAGGYPFISQ